MSIIKKLLSLGAIISMTVSSLSGIPAVKAEEPINSLSDLKVCSISEPLGIDETPVFS